MSLYNTVKEEGHYDIRRVKVLPPRGNFNILYAMKTTSLDKLYRWTHEGEYEEITLGGGATGPTVTNTSELVNDGSDGASVFVELDDVATVATTGNYDDLINKPNLGVESVTGGTDISVDNSDPLNPIINYTGTGGGGVPNASVGTISPTATFFNLPNGDLVESIVSASVNWISIGDMYIISARVKYIPPTNTNGFVGASISIPLGSNFLAKQGNFAAISQITSSADQENWGKVSSSRAQIFGSSMVMDMRFTDMSPNNGGTSEMVSQVVVTSDNPPSL